MPRPPQYEERWDIGGGSEGYGSIAAGHLPGRPGQGGAPAPQHCAASSGFAGTRPAGIAGSGRFGGGPGEGGSWLDGMGAGRAPVY